MGRSLHELKAYILADLNEQFPIKCEVTDTVVSLSIMEHLPEPQVFLNEVHRILKRGGAINERVAPWLDKYWKGEDDTVGYFVLARKA